MRFYFDTEFVEDGKTIDLISIAIVAEDGRKYYAISRDFDEAKAKAHTWVAANVLPFVYDDSNKDKWKTRYVIADEIMNFVGSYPEFWADYASYDWVALCQLYGTMMGLPSTWPMFCRDIQQLRTSIDAESFGTNLLEGVEHDALSDALECKARYEMLVWVGQSKGLLKM